MTHASRMIQEVYIQHFRSRLSGNKYVTGLGHLRLLSFYVGRSYTHCQTRQGCMYKFGADGSLQIIRKSKRSTWTNGFCSSSCSWEHLQKSMMDCEGFADRKSMTGYRVGYFIRGRAIDACTPIQSMYLWDNVFAYLNCISFSLKQKKTKKNKNYHD